MIPATGEFCEVSRCRSLPAVALCAVGVSFAVKEALYRMTLKVGKDTGSPVLIANAWHHDDGGREIDDSQ